VSLPPRGNGALSGRYTEALTYAATLHRDQMRKGTKVPYLSHLLAVSALVLEDGGCEDEAIGALLHDAVEDQGVELLAYIDQVFGTKVADIVKACSDAAPAAGEPKRPWLERKTAYVASLATKDMSALRVTAADKLHNATQTLVDIRHSHNGRTWPKFNACVHESLWFYGAISQVVRERLFGSRTAVELERVVTDLHDVSEVPRAADAADEPARCSCPDSARDAAS
jgi:(p)ppGpp synthase/HD superfamily hydrolase